MIMSRYHGLNAVFRLEENSCKALSESEHISYKLPFGGSGGRVVTSVGAVTALQESFKISNGRRKQRVNHIQMEMSQLKPKYLFS